MWPISRQVRRAPSTLADQEGLAQRDVPTKLAGSLVDKSMLHTGSCVSRCSSLSRGNDVPALDSTRECSGNAVLIRARESEPIRLPLLEGLANATVVPAVGKIYNQP